MEMEHDNLAAVCNGLESRLPISSREILEEFDLVSGHPWEETAKSELTNYYACLYGLACHNKPKKVLEIGTAFGMSAATMLKACEDIELFVSIDLGIYSEEFGFAQNNMEFTRGRVHRWCRRTGVSVERVRFYRANTQPPDEGDIETDVMRWHQNVELVRLLESHEFDVIFVDGKHIDDGLLNDLKTFWPFLRPGGLMLCDDLHDEKANFAWAGHTVRSFEEFLETHGPNISDSYIWNFPQVVPGGHSGIRPFGLIRKTKLTSPMAYPPGFATFDDTGAMKMNGARQDHLASLGLDLAGTTVLEVGSGVGWQTAFFEKLGCQVMSTDARLENVDEHCRRFPRRRVQVADLRIPGSHESLGAYDVVHCYGVLYHLSDPALCIKDMAKNCRELFLIETCVSLSDDDDVTLVEENKGNPNQSVDGIGCRAGRKWIMTTLRENFPHVYVTTCQPNHREFPLEWPAVLAQGVRNARSVFVASRTPLDLPTLSRELSGEQMRVEELLFSCDLADTRSPTTC